MRGPDENHSPALYNSKFYGGTFTFTSPVFIQDCGRTQKVTALPIDTGGGAVVINDWCINTSTEVPVTAQHHHDMAKRLLQAKLTRISIANTSTINPCMVVYLFSAVLEYGQF